jgi:DNA-directed RNA polymerase subunit beta
MELRYFGKVEDAVAIPSLARIQTESYARFLQADVAPGKRNKGQGIEGILEETFPIESHDGATRLEYVHYEFGRPRYTPEESRQLRFTYGMPFIVRLRLILRGQAVEEDVYLGDMPIMLGGGQLIVNGTERVIVTQLHRSPGIDFVEEARVPERRLHSCRIIPERGSWIEFNVTRRDTLEVRIDQSGKFPASMLLRASSPDLSTDSQIVKLFYSTTRVRPSDSRGVSKLSGKVAVGDVVDKSTGEVIVESGQEIDTDLARKIKAAKVGSVEVVGNVDDPLILNTLREDKTHTREEALLKIYGRLRPGNPPNLKRAEALFQEKFFDANRYRLGRVGRFRINRKLKLGVPESHQTLHADDLLSAMKYLVQLRAGAGSVDDIDHLGNRRLRTIEELAGDELRKGFLKLRRTVQERMTLKNQDQLSPRVLVNSKTVSTAIEYFFSRSELSQVADQRNPLAELAHERRLSALGPGGLNRKRAGFDVRDVHTSHYGRICPIETPEGTNIGLITYLAIYASVDGYGFLTTPYREVKKGKLDGKVKFLRADEEDEERIAPADLKTDEQGRIKEESVLARYRGDFSPATAAEVSYADVSTKQMVGLSASLIPFLEHDDANRALMGSTMQKQAVPLLVTDQPVVCTGMEPMVGENSSMVVKAKNGGVVKKVTADYVEVGDDVYRLEKFKKLNERTCQNQRPIVKEGERVKAGQIIADGAATKDGELALGRNVLVAYMPWGGYNFEDSVLVSERFLKDDFFTSVHIEEHESEVRETKLGREEFTRDIPNVSEKALRNLDEEGIVRIGTCVREGDILVGKVSPKTKTELSPEEKLLYAIFGRAGEDVKNDSLTVPSGVEGVVIDAHKFKRKAYVTEEERKRDLEEVARVDKVYDTQFEEQLGSFVATFEEITGRKLADRETGEDFVVPHVYSGRTVALLKEKLSSEKVAGRMRRNKAEVEALCEANLSAMDALQHEKGRRVDRIKRGDELPSGVLEMVKVYVATKRTLSVGDKMAGRHGNKGVISKIVPEEDMPFLEDGTPLEMILSPLGVPGRMNVGQLMETHLGWTARKLGFRAVCPVFDGASEEDVRRHLREAGLPENGKVTLYDGQTGEPYDQEVTVGYIYMMKLDHLVDDKVHARATGPYSLIMQQPLGGKARSGGQRFGEMEVWALEAYGAAYTLQELWTVKSDDVEGRTKMYEAMVKGENVLEPGPPVSVEVLQNEIRGLALDLAFGGKKI